MHNVNALNKLIETDKVKLVQIVSVPRSRSTAIGRAFGQSSEGDTRVFINEPFHLKTGSEDEGFGHILEVARSALRATEGSLTVVAKSMAVYTSPETFRTLSAMAVGTIFTIRDPNIQIGSLLLRGINDSLIGPGADKIKPAELPEYLGDLSGVYGTSRGYRMDWEPIWRHHKNRFPDNPSVVIDGDVLVRNPSRILQRSCQRLNLPYHDGMVGGWQPGDYVNVGGSGGTRKPENSAWTRDATISTGLSSIAMREQLDLSAAPAELRTYIEEVAIPAYNYMSGFAVT